MHTHTCLSLSLYKVGPQLMTPRSTYGQASTVSVFVFVKGAIVSI